MRKIKQSVVFALAALLLIMMPVSANASTFPEIIDLPLGFRPEGIAVGRGSTFFTGSLADGRVLRGDLRTGEIEGLVAGQTGMLSGGMTHDRRSGDVIVTDQAAFFTNSSAAVLYRLPLGPQGSLPAADGFEILPLSREWSQVAGFNANGIEATADGQWLVVVNSTVGKLYRVDPWTGAAVEIDLGGESVSSGDGLLFHGSLLYVLRNSLNELVTIDLAEDLTSGVVVDRSGNPNFNVPTTLAAFGDALFAVNAKFSTPPIPSTPYEIVRVELH